MVILLLALPLYQSFPCEALPSKGNKEAEEVPDLTATPKQLSRRSVELSVRAFGMKPKCMLYTTSQMIFLPLESGCTLIQSPQTLACETTEDCFGRISILSRRRNVRRCDLRFVFTKG